MDRDGVDSASGGVGHGGGDGGGRGDGGEMARLTEARWAAMSGNERRKWKRCGGRRRPATAPLGESAPPPTAGD